MAAIPRNPYVAGNPVGDSPAYVGRGDVLRDVLRILRHDQQNAIVLYGQRRIGKTSILQHLAARLPEEGSYCPVYFDLQDKAALPLGHVLQDLADAIAYALGKPAPHLGSDPEAAFRDEWLPATLASLREGSAVVLLLDEFDVLTEPDADQAAKAFFPYLRGLLASDPGRLQFEFVIGRNIDDLDNIALSVFKGTPARRISLLGHEDMDRLVRLSEANETLHWPEEAVKRVWHWTHGHPFLTQQLCSHVWERAYDEISLHEEPEEPPAVTPVEVDAAVPEVLEASGYTMEWLWDGLPPAERVVASALAEAGPTAITPEALERLLRDSGVRVLIRELQSAPDLLQKWDLIEPTDGGYRFRVELLRRWIAEQKPLRRVQEELDYIEPVAENLYQAALGLYQGRQLEGAVDLLRRAIALNPNHVRANQLLADILLAQGDTGEAVEFLQRLYEYQPAAARPRLVQALLTKAQEPATEDEQLHFYERVLDLDPLQPEAAAGKRSVWKRRGDSALASGDLDAALEAYQTAGISDSVDKVREEIRRRTLATELRMLEKAEQRGAYQQALGLTRTLADRFPEERDWKPDLERLERKTQLKDLYQRGLGALQSGDQQTAQTALAQVVALEPGYEEATRYLHLAVTGVDPGGMQPPVEVEAPGRVEARVAKEREKARRQKRLAALDKLVRSPPSRDYWVKSVAFSPDGMTLAAGLSDNTVDLWNVETGNRLYRLKGHSFGVESVAFSPDGMTLASGSWNGAVILWDVKTGEQLCALGGRSFGVQSLAFSLDGTILASGSADNRVILWDLEAGKQLRTLEGHSDDVDSVAFSPDGTILASGSADSTVILWDVETGEHLRKLEGHSIGANSVAFSANGTTLASGSWGVILWDVETGQQLRMMGGQGIYVLSVAFSPDGTTLATGTTDAEVILWDTETGNRLRTLRGSRSTVQSVAFSPDGWMVTAGTYGGVILWDVATGDQLREL